MKFVAAAAALALSPLSARAQDAQIKAGAAASKADPEAAAVLMPKRWNPAVRKALEELIARAGAGGPNFNDQEPPIAVFSLDDVAAAHYPGEAVFHRVVDRADLKADETFWKLVPPPFRQRARAGWLNFKDQKQASWAVDPYYGMFRKAMFGAYETLCSQWGTRTCRPWLAKVMTGFGEDELAAYVVQALKEEEARPLGVEDVVESPGDERPVRIRAGLRVIPEMRDLVGALTRRGFGVYMISESSQWAAEAMAGEYGVPPERVIGPRTRLRNRIVTGEVLDPIPVGVGQSEAMTMLLGRTPALLIGSSKDKNLLGYGGSEPVRVVIDDGNVYFREYAKKKGWLLQSTFVPAAARLP